MNLDDKQNLEKLCDYFNNLIEQHIKLSNNMNHKNMRGKLIYIVNQINENIINKTNNNNN